MNAAPALTTADAAKLYTELDRVLEHDVFEQLDVTITRTDSLTPERLGSSGHKERTVPFNQAASDARVELERVVRVHAHKIAGYLGVTVLPGPRNHAAFLREHVAQVVGLEGSQVVATDILGACQRAWRAVDRRPERVYVGQCERCKDDLRASKTATEVRCVTCRCVYRIADRRADMLAKARDQLGTAATLARTLPWFAGKPLKANTITQWARRGKLEGIEVEGVVLYRIGDVIALQTGRAS